MIQESDILLTGGSGRLGTELRSLLPRVQAPSSQELDIRDATGAERIVRDHAPRLIVHAAAYTNVARAETERERCWSVNVDGTRNLAAAALAHAVPMVFISTDYVFWGDRGNYAEEDTPGPVRNYYSLSKLAAEQIVRLLPRHLVVRTSFRPRSWEYPVAFTDVFTSQDYVDILAPEIALAVQNFEMITDKILHIGTERKSVFELARRRNTQVAPASKATASVALPDDVSLNTARWSRIRETLLTETPSTP